MMAPPMPASSATPSLPAPAGTPAHDVAPLADDPGADDKSDTETTPNADATRWIDPAIAVGVASVAFAVYLRSLLPGVGYAGDTAKWQLMGIAGGVPHPTGYPMYIAIDQAWVRIVPWGSVAWRVNLLSAVFGAAAVAVVYIVLRILDVRQGVAAATALVFAFSPTFWSQSVVAEVYTLHVLFLASVTACLAYWRKGASNGWLLAGLGLYALSFGHHLTTGLALPGIAWLVWANRDRAVTKRNVAFVFAAIAVSASQYLYLLYLSDVGRYHEARIDTLGDVLTYVTGGRFKDSMFNYSWYGLLVARVPLLFRFVREEYVVLLVPIALGIWQGLQRRKPARRDIAIHLLSLGIFTAVYILNFDVPDLIVFCLPMFLAMAVFLGLGLDAVVGWAAERWSDVRWFVPAVAVGLTTLVAIVAVADYGRSSQRGNVEDAQRIERALDAAGSHAVLLTDDYHDSEFFWYYLLAEGMDEDRDLSLANQVTPAQVRDYFRGHPGLVSLAADQVVGTDDPPLYTATPNQAWMLVTNGFTVTEVATSVWRIDPPK